MPRIPRLVVPGHPHHVTQRGNRRQKTFFYSEHYLAYLEFIAAAKPKAGWGISGLNTILPEGDEYTYF